jgi:hypothetical protein
MDQRKKAADAVLELVASGQTLSEACRQPNMPSRSTIYAWLDTDQDFAQRFERALERGGDAVADFAHHIAENTTKENAAANRIILDALKWRAARLNVRYAAPVVADIADDGTAAVDIEEVRGRFFAKLDAITDRLSMTPAAVISTALHAAGPLDFVRDRDRIIEICTVALGPAPIGQSGNPEAAIDPGTLDNVQGSSEPPLDVAASGLGRPLDEWLRQRHGR